MITKKIIRTPDYSFSYTDRNTITTWYFLGIPFWRVTKITTLDK